MEKIRFLENKQGTNQKLFAANISINDRHLRRIEKGQTNPTLETIFQIALELNLSPSELLKLNNEGKVKIKQQT